MWNLNERAIHSLIGLPETGMAFSSWKPRSGAMPRRCWFSIPNVRADLSEIGPTPGDDPAVILRNGLPVIEALKSDVVLTMIAAPGPYSFRLLSSRIGTIPAASAPSSVSASTA